MHYCGRFAPSPTGALHFGSLLAAVASYVQARAQNGSWFVRIENIDPPREQTGAAEHILRTLEHFGLHGDRPVVWQSEQSSLYQQNLQQLTEAGLVYPCHCSRRQIRERGGLYDRQCYRHGWQPGANDSYALRLLVEDTPNHFHDQLFGHWEIDPAWMAEDFIIRRRDRYWAYHLAVVSDDIEQGVTEVVRGFDLIDNTPRHCYLFHKLGHRAPGWLHIPLAMHPDGSDKLSKQTFARPLPEDNPGRTLSAALTFLGHPPPLSVQRKKVEAILDWAVLHWRLEQLPRKSGLPVPGSY